MLRPIPLLQKKRIPKNPTRPIHPIHSSSVFCSGPIGDYKSWEVFHPVERSELLVEKLHLKFDLKPPKYPGDISWWIEWEIAVLDDSSLWTVHQKLLLLLQF